MRNNLFWEMGRIMEHEAKAVLHNCCKTKAENVFAHLKIGGYLRVSGCAEAAAAAISPPRQAISKQQAARAQMDRWTGQKGCVCSGGAMETVIALIMSKPNSPDSWPSTLGGDSDGGDGMTFTDLVSEPATGNARSDSPVACGPKWMSVCVSVCALFPAPVGGRTSRVSGPRHKLRRQARVKAQ